MNDSYPADSRFLDLDQLANLSREELAEWIIERLQGRDLRFPAQPSDEMPHYAVAVLYLQIDHSRRLDIERIVLDCLRDVLSTPGSWHGQAADELLMLVDPVLVHSQFREVAVDLPFRLATDFNSKDTPDLRLRALQSLSILGHRASREFWFEQFRSGGDAYAAVVLGGLLRQLQLWDERKVVSPRHEGHRRVYFAAEVIEITVIAELRRKGFSLQKIRRVLRFLQREMGKRLAEVLQASSDLNLVTDGKSIYLEDQHDRIIDILKNARQPMFLVSVSDQARRAAMPTWRPSISVPSTSRPSIRPARKLVG